MNELEQARMRVEAQKRYTGPSNGCDASPIRRGNAPIAERLIDRLYRAQQTEAQARQEEQDIREAIAMLKAQPNIEAILDAIAKVGLL